MEEWHVASLSSRDSREQEERERPDLVAEWQWQTDQTQWKSGMWPRSLQRDELRIGVFSGRVAVADRPDSVEEWHVASLSST